LNWTKFVWQEPVSRWYFQLGLDLSG
jgi:hypothetical protein